MKLDQEARMTIRCLAGKGQSGRAIARMLGVTEGAVRYHVRRKAAGSTDGRTLQTQLGAGWSEAIAEYLGSLKGERVNLAALHEWLVAEHDYSGSLRSVERYVRRAYPKPKRARRRVETPPGAQAQADWAEWPELWIRGRVVYGYEFNLRLSHNRFGARVWSPRKDQISWHHVHNEAFPRIEGSRPRSAWTTNERR